jgi:hypothetical protein
MTAEFWEHDARLGRRWNIDRIFYAGLSSYLAFKNNPIIFIDSDGLEAVVPEDPPSKGPKIDFESTFGEFVVIATRIEKPKSLLGRLWSNVKNVWNSAFKDFKWNHRGGWQVGTDYEKSTDQINDALFGKGWPSGDIPIEAIQGRAKGAMKPAAKGFDRYKQGKPVDDKVIDKSLQSGQLSEKADANTPAEKAANNAHTIYDTV